MLIDEIMKDFCVDIVDYQQRIMLMEFKIRLRPHLLLVKVRRYLETLKEDIRALDKDYVTLLRIRRFILQMDKEESNMKTKQKMTFLRKEKFEGVSKKTGIEYSITNLFFLDDEFQEVKLGVSKNCELDLETLKQLKPYEVTIDIQLGQYFSANVVDFKAI